MITFAELMAELTVVKRGPVRKHVPKAKLMQKAKNKKKLGSNVPTNAQGIARVKIKDGKKVQRSADEIQRATKRTMLGECRQRLYFSDIR